MKRPATLPREGVHKIGVWMTTDEHREFKARLAARGISMSEYLREKIQEAIGEGGNYVEEEDDGAGDAPVSPGS